MKKIALVSYDIQDNNMNGHYPPLHLCMLATSLRIAGYDVAVFDYVGPTNRFVRFLMDNVVKFRPDVTGVTLHTPDLKSNYGAIRIIRARLPKTTLIAGGAHPTVRPKETLGRIKEIDYAMQGECDRSIVWLLEMLSGKREEKNVPGLIYRRDDSIYTNERDYIPDLNALPQVDRSFLDQYYKANMYWYIGTRRPFDVMITSRGCSNRCTFCYQFEKNIRLRNADHIMTEFEYLKRRGIRGINIQDDTFTVSRNRCIEIADRLIRSGYHFDLRIRSRSNLIDYNILKKLRSAGVGGIVYGFESGSQKMLDNMKKGTTVKASERAIILTKGAGITCYGDIMIGCPGETRETINETMAFLHKYNPIISHIGVLFPLPGTEVYEMAKKDGTLRGEFDIDQSLSWVKLPWIDSYADLRLEALRLGKIAHRDFKTILYFIRTHITKIGWKELNLLYSLFTSYLLICIGVNRFFNIDKIKKAEQKH